MAPSYLFSIKNSTMSPPYRPFRNVLVAAGVLAALCAGRLPMARSGEVWLKNGMKLSGTPVWLESLPEGMPLGGRAKIKSDNILMIHSGLKRYYIARRQKDEISFAADLSRYETFPLQQRRTDSRLKLDTIGRFVEITPFDEHGRRRVTFARANQPLPVVQGITRIHPQYVTVEGLNCVWKCGIATTSLPRPTLDAMIRRVTDQENADDRFGIARFYLQADMHLEALEELRTIARDFPESQARVEKMELQARQLFAERLLQELRYRQAAGQHRLVYRKAKEFPVEKMSASVLRDVRELITEYDERVDKAETALALLGDLQAQLGDPELREAVKPLRARVAEQLDHESLNRLDAFLMFADDETLSAAEKLGLAYSGWVLGSSNAVSDLEAARRLWEARFLIMEYLQTDDAIIRKRLLTTLQRLEGVGAKTLLQLIPLLPPAIETPGLVSGRVLSIPLESGAAATAEAGQEGGQEGGHEAGQEGGDRSRAYSVLLPLEYTPHHQYPMIVALHAEGRTAERELVWWGGTQDEPLQSQRHGYIVMAPHYAKEGQQDYDYSADSHQVVLDSIRDARKRFSVDSDRVFLSGHGMGGDAAFDMGMSHPDLFAGVIPITGLSDRFCMFYRPNAQQTAWYVISGELDRETFKHNRVDLDYMLKHGYDVILAEYIGRGYESYYEEIHRLFEWMDKYRRTKYPKEVEVRTLRPSDSRFFWIEADGLPKSVTDSPVSGGRGKHNRPMEISLRSTPGNTIRVSSGAEKNTIWLSSDLIDFDTRVTVFVNGRRESRGFLRPDMETTLEDLRTRGDRQKLYSVRMDFE